MIRPQTVFRGPHRRPNGLAADSDSLWICDMAHLVARPDIGPHIDNM